MVTLSSSTRSFIFLSIFIASQAAYQDTCSYVKIAADMDVTPMQQWNFVYPLDICNTYQLVAGQPTYQKYVCNDAGQIRLETWDTNTCDGALSASEDPATLGLTVDDFSCDTYGDCSYMTVKYYPEDTAGCDDAGVYKEEAIIPDVCAITNTNFYVSFYWSCDKTVTKTQELSMSCPADAYTVADATGGCVDGFNDLNHAWMGFWDVSSDGCVSVTYSNPTMNPTTEPTVEPTVVPTSDPSENPSSTPSESPSRNPSESPSESPSRNPSQTPSESPSAEPTVEPTNGPSKAPSKTPSAMPTMSPSDNPVASETTAAGDDDDSGASYITLAVNVAIAICLSLAI